MVVTHGALQATRGRCALTIGNFDGVHRGHRALIDRVGAKARELKLASCVLTFEPHPREFFSRDAAPARLTRLRDKHELLRGLGARWLLVGRDFRFGARRAGDFATLEEAAVRHGFRLEAMPDVLFEGERVSSSAVRGALGVGDLRRAARLLGHPYTLSGRVAHGAKLGRALGFPTANIMLRRTPPLGGVFAVEVEGLGPGVASVGKRPTVNPVPVPLLEVHLFDCDQELYGRHLKVCFLEKLRDEKKYDGIDALKQAIAQDASRAREYFARHG